MSRRITTGEVGGAVGGLNVTNTTLTTADNVDIIVNPRGTARFVIDGDAQLQSQGDLRFADSDSSNYVAFQAPATISSNYTLTLPNSDGTSNQVLTTNGAGTLSWTTAAVSISDNTTDSGTNYLAFTTSTTGTITAARVSSTKLTFQPSTGTLTSTAISTVTLTETSSIAYKENINPISDALEKVLQLTGVVYDRKDGSRNCEPGFIAEDVEKIIPNVITYKDGRADGITYTKLTAYLVEAVKMLNAEIIKLQGDKR